MSKVDSIKFRMYNTGSVGDCLLLLFQKNNSTSFSILIDCGGWSSDASEISACVEDIKTTCNGKVDLLIITHEHKDHMSGFNQARSVFDKIKFESVWLSWVENDDDPIAAIVKEKYVKELKKIQKSAQDTLERVQNISQGKNIRGAKKRIENAKANLKQTLEAIDFELGLPGHKDIKKGMALTVSDAMKYVKARKKPDYKNPGEVITNIKGAEGIKFYILGPPKSEDLAFFKTPLIDEEMYHFALSPDTLKLSASRKMYKSGVSLSDKVSPFNEKYLLTGKEEEDFQKKYNSPDLKWRQIESDFSGSEMALTGLIGRLVNNTSLAIAIELEGSGNIMLLPADAQSGNWMSWHDPSVSEKLKHNGGKNIKEIFENTVFYKVGHHGSHNGTASQHGLDMMTNKNLVAFMPLVQKSVPTQWGGANNFPAKALYNVLIEKTNGKMVRTDEGLITDPKAIKLRKSISTQEAKSFAKNLKEGNCYHEYNIT